jgi:hypothetical protein
LCSVLTDYGRMSVQFCEKENWDSNRNESFFYFKLEGCFRFG